MFRQGYNGFERHTAKKGVLYEVKIVTDYRIREHRKMS